MLQKKYQFIVKKFINEFNMNALCMSTCNISIISQVDTRSKDSQWLMSFLGENEGRKLGTMNREVCTTTAVYGIITVHGLFIIIP